MELKSAPEDMSMLDEDGHGLVAGGVRESSDSETVKVEIVC
jgi:hypothetical protein